MYIFVLCFIYKVIFGINFICLVVFVKDGDDFVLDMVIISVVFGKVNCLNYVCFFFKYKILNVFKRKIIMILMFFFLDRVVGKKG